MSVTGTGERASRLIGRSGALIAGLGFIGAVALAVQAGRGPAASATILGVGFTVDEFAAVLLLLVFGVSTVVQAFAVRYLAGDARAAWFTGGAVLLTAASAGLVTVDSLIGLAVCWTVAGIALCLLLATYWHLPDARDGVRRTVMAFVIGDLALWTAVALATAARGSVDLRTTTADAVSGPLVTVMAVLIVLAALSRSAQIPFHRWLPATLAAPTPVSALLHAGVVNAGGILLIRLGGLFHDDLARGLTVAAGVATMVYGGIVMLVKPDVKGALAYSTTAQMGFMILTCGLGLWAAAVIHLVAHGFYKSTLFLSSGSAIARHRRISALPPVAALSRHQKMVNAAAALGLPAAALALAVTWPFLPRIHAADVALLVFAWVTGAVVTWGWLQRRPGRTGMLASLAFLVPTAIAYVAVITAVTSFLTPALPPTTLSAPTVWVVIAVTLAVLGGLAVLRWMPAAGRARGAVYSYALGTGTIPSVRPSFPALQTGVRS